MATQQLFTVPIYESTNSQKVTGSFICTSPTPGIYLLTFNAPPDNRLVTTFCQSFLIALDIIEFQYPPGVLITTSGIAKFYSNGLDLDHAGSTKGFWADTLYRLWARLLTYPMPTIALLNGHAFAGGLMLGMFHDYRIFNPTRGFLCLNELDFGYPLKPAMSSIFKQKVPYPAVYRSLVLEAKRFTAKEALEGGIVDILGGMDEVLTLVKDRKLTEKGKTGIYGIMKAEMYKETLALLLDHDAAEWSDRRYKEGEEKRKIAGRKSVDAWLKANGIDKAKL